VAEPVTSTELVKGNGNLRPPWPKGVSQNPGGLPAGTKRVKSRLRNALIRRLKAKPDQIEAIVDGLINACADGDGACQRIAWDRLDGPITAKTDLSVNVTYTKRIVDEEDDDHDSP
jgi:hypothetical protein